MTKNQFTPSLLMKKRTAIIKPFLRQLNNLRFTRNMVLIAVFLFSLVIRLIFVFQWHHTPYGDVPLLDAKAYDEFAQAIAQGHLLRDKAFFWSPLFPYILALLYSIFGHGFVAVSIFNALLGAFTAVILSAIAFSCFGLGAALITGFLAASYGSFVFYTAPIMKEPLGLFLLSLFLLLALRALEKNRLRDFFWSGSLLGLGVLVRGNALFLAPAIIMLAIFKWRQKAWKNVAVFIATTILFIIPATLHNFIVSKDFVPISYGDGYNLYIGNSPTANGINSYPPGIPTDSAREEVVTAWIARSEIGHDLKPSEVSKFWRARALDYIWNNPRQAAVLLKNKTEAFWNNAEVFDIYDIDFIKKNFPTIMNFWLPQFCLISSLAAFAAVALGRHRRNVVIPLILLTAAYMASVLLFYVTERYRLPVVIFLLPLAGAALPCALQLIRAKNWPLLAGATALACFFLFLGLRRDANIGSVDLTAFDWGTLSTIEASMGRDQEAIDSLHKGLLISPRDVGSAALIMGSDAELNLGHEDESIRLLNMAFEFYPQDVTVFYSDGRQKAAKGDLPAALDALQKAVAVAPDYVLSYYAQALVYDKLGQHDSARQAVKNGLAIDPTDRLLLDLSAQWQQQ